MNLRDVFFLISVCMYIYIYMHILYREYIFVRKENAVSLTYWYGMSVHKAMKRLDCYIHWPHITRSLITTLKYI